MERQRRHPGPSPGGRLAVSLISIRRRASDFIKERLRVISSSLTIASPPMSPATPIFVPHRPHLAPKKLSARTHHCCRARYASTKLGLHGRVPCFLRFSLENHVERGRRQRLVGMPLWFNWRAQSADAALLDEPSPPEPESSLERTWERGFLSPRRRAQGVDHPNQMFSVPWATPLTTPRRMIVL